MVEWTWIWGKWAPYSLCPCAKELIHPVTDRATGQLASCAGVHPRMLTPGWRRNQSGQFQGQSVQEEEGKTLAHRCLKPSKYTFLSLTVAEDMSSIQNNNTVWTPILEFFTGKVPSQRLGVPTTPCFQVWSCDCLFVSGVLVERIDNTLGLSCTFFSLSFLFSLANWIQRILRS